MNLIRAGELLRKFSGRRILVVGDVMLDEYIWGQVSRISPEAPVMVVDAERYSSVPGGAANVVNNLCALGATGIVMGVVGSDSAGETLIDALLSEGADTTGVLRLDDRPTTRKTRIVAHAQQVVRVDHETRRPLSQSDRGRLRVLLEELVPGCDAIILSDYLKGVLGPETIHDCVQLAHLYCKPITGNLKPSTLSAACNVSVVTLNLHEAGQVVGGAALNTDELVEFAGAAILQTTGAQHVLITRGASGLSLFSAETPTRPHHVPARPVAVFDVAGAGDTVVSTMTVALAVGASPVEAVELANYAASEVVKKLGVATVTASEIESAMGSKPLTSEPETVLAGAPA